MRSHGFGPPNRAQKRAGLRNPRLGTRSDFERYLSYEEGHVNWVWSKLKNYCSEKNCKVFHLHFEKAKLQKFPLNEKTFTSVGYLMLESKITYVIYEKNETEKVKKMRSLL